MMAKQICRRDKTIARTEIRGGDGSDDVGSINEPNQRIMRNHFERISSKNHFTTYIYNQCVLAFCQSCAFNKSNKSNHNLIDVDFSSTCIQLITIHYRCVFYFFFLFFWWLSIMFESFVSFPFANSFDSPFRSAI